MSDPIREKRFKHLKVSAELVLGLLQGLREDEQGNIHVARMEENGEAIPAGCRVVAIMADQWDGTFSLRLAHESFPVVEKCHAIPDLRPMYTTIHAQIKKSYVAELFEEHFAAVEAEKKGPLGVPPRWLWEEQHPKPVLGEIAEREKAVVAAVQRYRDAGKEPKAEWMAELAMFGFGATSGFEPDGVSPIKVLCAVTQELIDDASSMGEESYAAQQVKKELGFFSPEANAAFEADLKQRQEAAKKMESGPRESWMCDGDCGGCGVCCAPGCPPDPLQHMIHNPAGGERVCGTFVYEGPCEACTREDREEAEQATSQMAKGSQAKDNPWGSSRTCRTPWRIEVIDEIRADRSAPLIRRGVLHRQDSSCKPGETLTDLRAIHVESGRWWRVPKALCVLVSDDRTELQATGPFYPEEEIAMWGPWTAEPLPPGAVVVYNMDDLREQEREQARAMAKQELLHIDTRGNVWVWPSTPLPVPQDKPVQFREFL